MSEKNWFIRLSQMTHFDSHVAGFFNETVQYMSLPTQRNKLIFPNCATKQIPGTYTDILVLFFPLIWKQLFFIHSLEESFSSSPIFFHYYSLTHPPSRRFTFIRVTIFRLYHLDMPVCTVIDCMYLNDTDCILTAAPP